MNKKIAVALSGGVDSSVAALLLKRQGFDVIGITAKTTNSPEAENIILNARNVASKLQIPFYEFNATKIFEEKVIRYFEEAYKIGETPNPCIMCNKYMKWGALFDFAIDELGADYMATGHYADIKELDGIFKLYPASDEHKDQLYFLFMLNQKQLQKTLFPLSSYIKIQVRQLVEENNLPSKSWKESQDICFIQVQEKKKKYLNNILSPQEGKFIEKSTGKVLGKHTGFWQYTIGQRKGIGLAAPEALYVTDIDAKSNTVYVGYKKDLFSSSLILNNMNWTYPPEALRFKANIKVRYNMKSAPAKIIINTNEIIIKFDTPISAIAKGQACVLYDITDGHLIGGGFI